MSELNERRLWWLLIILVLVGLNTLVSGCSAWQRYFGSDADRTQSFFERLQAASIEDLQRANQLAQVAQPPDVLAQACWPVLIDFVSSLKKDPAAVGPFSFYQRLRNLRRAIDTGVPDSLRLACSAMVQDSRDAVLRFMGQISTIAGMAGS